MSTTRHRRKSGILTGVVGTTLAAALAAGGIIAMNNSAFAAPVELDPAKKEDADKINQLMGICDSILAPNSEATKTKCTWSDVSIAAEDAKGVIVGDLNNAQKFVNCGDGLLRETVSWSRNSQTALKVGLTVEVKDTINFLFASFEEEVSFIGNTAWTFGRTYTETTLLEVPGGDTGWITHAEKRVKGTGTLHVELGIGTENAHQQYTIKNIQFDAPSKEGRGAIATHSRKHTAADTELCKAGITPDSADAEGGGLVAADGSDLPDQG